MELLIGVALGLVVILLLTRPRGGASQQKPPGANRARWADPSVQKVFDRARKRSSR